MYQTPKLRLLLESEATFKIKIEPCDFSPSEHFDDTEILSAIEEESEWNEYAWCDAIVTASWEGFTATTSLGAISILRKYSPNIKEAFDECYLEDLKYEALHELNQQLQVTLAKLCKLVQE